jgi:hypothetical protein
VGREGLEQLEKFNALKASKPEVVVTVGDHMGLLLRSSSLDRISFIKYNSLV